jgi:hypothetical protein
MHAPGLPRISLPQAAGEGAFSPIRTIKGAFGFFNVVLSAAKDWQDEMMSVLPGQRQRVVRIRLDEGEGRLNLGMEPELSRRLMGYGSEAGQKIRAGFKFEEHRYRRTLVAYKHLRELTEGFARTWPGYSSDYRTYAPNAISYKTMVGSPARLLIADHLDALAGCATAFQPPLPGKPMFPRPSGCLRIVPEA